MISRAKTFWIPVPFVSKLVSRHITGGLMTYLKDYNISYYARTSLYEVRNHLPYFLCYRSRRGCCANPSMQTSVSQGLHRPMAVRKEDLSNVQNGYFEALWAGKRKRYRRRRRSGWTSWRNINEFSIIMFPIVIEIIALTPGIFHTLIHTSLNSY